MVIGSLLSAAAITYFSIGARIMDYSFQLVVTLAQLFIPMSSQSEAVGNMDRVRKIYIAGNRACALVYVSAHCYRADLGQVDHRSLGRPPIRGP